VTDSFEEPIRGEVYGLERLGDHARILAESHQLSADPRRGRPLLQHFAITRRQLFDAQRHFAEQAQQNRGLPPVAEWLLDNFYIVQTQINQVANDLSPRYYRELPKLAAGPYAGFPRVYHLALELIAHTDSVINHETATHFVRQYQAVAPLSTGELWAVAIMLRIGLVENLRRLAGQAMISQRKRAQADQLANRLLRRETASSLQTANVVAELVRGHGGADSVFIVHLLERLRDQSPAVAPVVHWLEQWLAERGTDLETLMRADYQRRAANRLTVANVITSMRTIQAMDWNDFFEETSLVEAALRRDPAGVHAGMDFASRNRYRSVIERLSRRTGRPEVEIAGTVLEQTQRHAADSSQRQAHVGYYLLGRGRKALEAAVGYRRSLGEYAYHAARRYPTLLYLGSIGLITLAVLAVALWYAALRGASAGGLIVAAALLLLPLSALAANLVNWLITLIMPPDFVPRLEYEGGIPPESKTLVVVPALISSVQGIEQLFVNLEACYLANREPHLHFAILSDFADANEQHRPEDAELLEIAGRRVRELNERHAGGSQDRFYFLHRRRCWNERQQLWMGWERKRGKLIELNRLLRGKGGTNYTVQAGDVTSLVGVRYVITLDADTELPMNGARRLAGALAHPLNRPVYDSAAGRVLDGYAIIQPRAAVGAPAAAATRFARLFAGDIGVDPYSELVSSVYQDLFGAGTYIGKAIYDVDALYEALDQRFPENLLLSHDLLEGLFVRVAQFSQVQVLEDFPSGYDAYMQRQHRWVRGDWQIFDWLLPRVPVAAGPRHPNPLPFAARWRIVDNLRQSLVPPAILALLVLGWLWLPGSPLVWTVLALLAIAFPALTGLLTTSGIHPPGQPWLAWLRLVLEEAAQGGARALLSVAFVPFEAAVNLDATLRALVRRTITRRRLLEWQSAQQAEHGQARARAEYWRRMWIAPAVALALLPLMLLVAPAAWPVALPLLVLWLVSPELAHFVSQPARTRAHQPLSEAARRELRLTARRIWRFYEAYAGEDDNWLPPDNYQLEPRPVVAHRTSPTNIAFLLLSALAAHDFGCLNPMELADWLERTMASMDRLQRYRGHFLNWYNTQTLEPLAPGYVSTVDSGNLAAALFALKQGCLEVLDAPLMPETALASLHDLAAALRAALLDYKPESARGRAAASQMLDDLRRVEDHLAEPPPGLDAWLVLAERVASLAASLADRAETLEEGNGSASPAELRAWSRDLGRQVASFRAVLTLFLGWLPAVPAHHEPGPNGRHGAAWAELSAAGGQGWPSLRLLANLPALQPEPQSAPDARARLQPIAAEAYAGQAEAVAAARRLVERFEGLAIRAETTARAMQFGFLCSPERGVFSIGFNLVTQQLDNSYYDLLASEARLASFIAIAEGQVSPRHWFRLSRPLTWAGGGPVLLSWGGTMFEYLMPSLLMREYAYTLLAQTVRGAVEAHRRYGADRRVPWGISESGFYGFDYQFNYQYQAFGVPGLGLKRERSDNLVIAPYATFLALHIDPQAAWANLQHLAREGMVGSFGYYEAIDYTPARRPRGQRAGIVRSYMAHHQGMSLVALDNYLNGQAMRRRFHAEPVVAAVELLLQERLPRHVPLIEPHPEGRQADGRTPARQDGRAPAVRVLTTPHTAAPRAHLLSNGVYKVMVTNAGGGYSQFSPPGEPLERALAITRWQPDSTCDDQGTFIYIRDVAGGPAWSAGYQPTARPAEAYRVVFAADRVLISRRDSGIETDVEIVVSPRDNVEIRRVTLTNNSRRERRLELTSYAEVSLDAPAADLAHPAFSKLFVESEYWSEWRALAFQRRPRDSTQPSWWSFHLLAGRDLDGQELEYETDRARFLGRGGTARNPQALHGPLSNTTGAVLDPVMSLRCQVRLAPGASTRLMFITGVAPSRQGAEQLADRFSDIRIVEGVLDLAWVYSQVQLRHLSISDNESQLFQRLASRILFPDAGLRAPQQVLSRNTRGQPGLWAYGISGDYPLLVVRVQSQVELGLVRDLLHAHEYWRMNNFPVELLILNDHPTTYAEGLQAQIQSMIDTSLSRPWLDRPGGVFVRRTDRVPPEDLRLFLTAARVVLDGGLGSLSDQLVRASSARPAVAGAAQAATGIASAEAGLAPQDVGAVGALDRRFFNGWGGFTPNGREYVITLSAGQWTPAPWSNVLANEQFGCLVSESGLGYTWSQNSQLNRLTPWRNDPVSDMPGEALYLRDEVSGHLWSPTPLPIREHDAYPYRIRHGAGYSLYEREAHGLQQELLVTVPVDHPVKLVRLRLRNTGRQRRRLTLTAYAEWVLGVNRAQSQHFIVTDHDKQTGAVLARNTYTPEEFRHRIAFAHLEAWPKHAGLAQHPMASYTTDRTEFLGRNGTLARPASLEGGTFSGRHGAALDPCVALQVGLQLAPGEEIEAVFLLGQGADRTEAQALVEHYRHPAHVQAAFLQAADFWDGLLGTLQVRTPDAALDLMLNRWLLYQNLVCRIWARSAFYQSGGAYGFRDQLQDVLALLMARPDIARQHLLRAAARQFEAGDVQHWWHPDTGQGVRTRFSDDYLWLPYAVHQYVLATGDHAVLDEQVPFLRGPLLDDDQHEAFVSAMPTDETASLFDHCLRAIENGLRFGRHGLPLMGIGDWNDGMSRVGAGGQGESVWLGWFLYANLQAFAGLLEARGDAGRAERYRQQAAELHKALHEHGWDGAWYRRAYFDEGTPLGSAQNDECRIDSIAQSWAVLSGAAPEARVQTAFASLEEHLVRDDDRLLLLLTPPFHSSQPDPGYIQAYLPGIRENGGQYTHAAIWAIWGYLAQGQGDRAAELLAMINPVNHARTPEDAAEYKVEPYAVAADVYAHPLHTRRGGWTWYTGSAAWLYRLGIEALLGIRRRGEWLEIDPCLPRHWPGFEAHWRWNTTRFIIRVENEGVNRGVRRISLDGRTQPGNRLPLVDDGQMHEVHVVLGPTTQARGPG
jgi:cyclic beta-1,2-glucan synthetase